MTMPIEEFVHAGKKIVIRHDDQAESPRETCDNLATFACAHRRYRLGDKEASHLVKDACDEATLRERVDSEILAILPLYLFDHSGISISVGKFSCSFDSGQVGWAFVTKESAEKMGCVGDKFRHDPETGKMVPDGVWDQEALEKVIRGEVETYDDFLTGRCYGYQVIGAEDDNLESVWGFVGDLDYVRQEAREAAEHVEDPATQRMVDELASRATFAAGA